MSRAYVPRLAIAVAIGAAGCEEPISLDRRLSSFEVTLFSPVGTPENRCVLAGTPTVGIDLTGCPEYVRDASGSTVIRLGFEARAIDNRGELLETYDSLATVRMVPGKVDPAFRKVRFTAGTTAIGENRPIVAFRGAFDDAFLWLEDDNPPARLPELPGVGTKCGSEEENICAPAGLACVNSAPAVGYDPEGLAYCTRACDASNPCVEGYFCSSRLIAYDDAASDVSEGACLRVPPTYSAGVGGPIHLVQPTLADINRSDSLIQSPFIGEFIEVKRGTMIVTAVRIDGFYVTDIEGTEFNHLFVFNFSRPDDLFPGDKLISVGGPISEFTGLTELNFPLWEVDYANSPQEIPASTNLHERVFDRHPWLVERGGACFRNSAEPESLTLLDCNAALERLEAARVAIRVKSILPIVAGSDAEMDLERYGQWRILVDTGRRDLEMALITRDNIPFFDPRKLSPGADLGVVQGNMRTVAFNDEEDPLWVIEPRDQADCPTCVSP